MFDEPELNDFDGGVTGLELVDGAEGFEELPDENDRDGGDEDGRDEGVDGLLLELLDGRLLLELDDDRDELPDENDRLLELLLRDDDEELLDRPLELEELLPPFDHAVAEVIAIDIVTKNTRAKRLFIRSPPVKE